MSPLRKAVLSGAAFFLSGLLLAACSTLPWRSPHENADNLARAAKLERHKVSAPPFVLTTYRRSAQAAGGILTVYIEGDGAPWDSATRPPRDPTPLNPVSLRLAIQDKRAPLLYVARPCQYLDESGLAACDPRYWTRARFSPEVIDAVNQAVDEAKTAMRGKQVRLIGFSGGGVLAALLAIRRHDVDSLVTLAAPLDVAVWTAFHEISPLYESLNPVDFASALSRIRQIHFIGGRDKIVPPAYLSTLRDKTPFADYVVVPGQSHDCCWDNTWPALLPKDFQ